MHLSSNSLNKLSELNSSILKFDRELINQHQFVPCLVRNAKRSYIPSSFRKTVRPLESIHLDISVPFESSLEGTCYTAVIVDESKAASFVKALKKSELSNTIVEFKHCAEVELQIYGIKPKNTRLDRADEYLPNPVKEFCNNNSIYLEPSHACVPQSNGCAERLIPDHWTRALVVLFPSNLPKYLCPEAIHHAKWLRNRLPDSRIDNEIPIMHRKSNARIDHESLLEFRSPRFASIYYSETSRGQKLLPRTQFGDLSRYSFSTQIHSRLFVTQTFASTKVTHYQVPLPGVEAFLDGIAKQFEVEERLQKEAKAEAMLIQAFMATHISNGNPDFSFKKKFNHNLAPRCFDVVRRQEVKYRRGFELMHASVRDSNVYLKSQPLSKATFELLTKYSMKLGPLGEVGVRRAANDGSGGDNGIPGLNEVIEDVNNGIRAPARWLLSHVLCGRVSGSDEDGSKTLWFPQRSSDGQYVHVSLSLDLITDNVGPLLLSSHGGTVLSMLGCGKVGTLSVLPMKSGQKSQVQTEWREHLPDEDFERATDLEWEAARTELC